MTTQRIYSPMSLLSASFHYVSAGQSIAAIDAVGLRSAGFLSAMGAIDHLGTDLPIYHSISCIDFEDLRPEMLIGESKMISEKFPHGLACQSQFFKFLLCIILSSGKAIDLKRGEVSCSFGFFNLIVLKNIPNEAHMIVGVCECMVCRSCCWYWIVSEITAPSKAGTKFQGATYQALKARASFFRRGRDT